MMWTCPVCLKGRSRLYAVLDGYPYFECEACNSLHIDPDVIDGMDAGQAPLGHYAEQYWEQERDAALDRATGSGLSRAAETILYCRRPVRRFLDLGAGPGFLVNNLQSLVDSSDGVFNGVEKFPPSYAVRGSNYHIGDVADLPGRFDAGVCIEVIEHLTPYMLSAMIAGLAAVSEPGSFWFFNTGLPEYVKEEDPGYLDPLRRGHIISYSIKGLTGIFDQHGFTIGPLPGKSFAFFAEYQPTDQPDFETRIYHPVPENATLLRRNPLFHQLALESARSYLYYGLFLERTAWALSLNARLNA